MTGKPEAKRAKWEESLLEEISRARKEIELAEKAFQWAKNEPEAVDAALCRMEASIEHYNFLIKQAKRAGISLSDKDLFAMVLKTAQ
ncbi:MAG: DUF2508 family protein [Tepidanaerobacteraceae bacterium]|jgi:hypothetical protein|nr:DUF2508 family protein [Tepidanaerobacteraceae bacterium]